MCESWEEYLRDNPDPDDEYNETGFDDLDDDSEWGYECNDDGEWGYDDENEEWDDEEQEERW